MSEAFFVNLDNTLLPVDDAHIRSVINNASVFGLSEEYLKSVYDKYNEPYGIEGKAREEILRKIVNMGWIRIRHYQRPRDFWSLTVKKVSEKIESNIYSFANMIKDKKVSRSGSLYDELSIYSIETDRTISVTVNDVINGELFNRYLEAEKKDNRIRERSLYLERKSFIDIV